MSRTIDPPVGVLLFNLGGPDDQATVGPFLVNLFSDRDIIELPLGAVTQPIFARLIAALRGPSVRRNYALIGGGSPQLRITRAQATALEERLNSGDEAPRGDVRMEYGSSLSKTAPLSTRLRTGREEPPRALEPSAGLDRTSSATSRLRSRSYRVFIAMRYWHPSTEEALDEMMREGVQRIVTLTLFPHWSKATTGSSQKELERTLATPRWRDRSLTITSVDRYADDPLYLDAFADTVRRALDAFDHASRDKAVILFSAHGLPQKFVDEGDPYVGQIEATRRGLLERLSVPNRQVLGYQSRTGPVQWIGPGTDEIIERLGREGVKDVLIVPLSFVSDHIETLYEVDILFAEMARKAGIVSFRRPEALNTHPTFIEALARLVERHLDSQA